MMVEKNFTNHIKELYLGIHGSFTLSKLNSQQIAYLKKELEDVIKEKLNAAADTQIDQKDPRISVTLEEIMGDNLKFIFSFILAVKTFDPEKETSSDKFWRDQKLQEITKQKVHLAVIELQEKMRKIEVH